MTTYKEVGKVRWIEYNSENKDMSILIDIFDSEYKLKLLHNKNLQNKLKIIDENVVAPVEE